MSNSPEQFAKELIEKYEKQLYQKTFGDYKKEAREVAIISCQLILDELMKNHRGTADRIRFYEQVKTIIENS